jgi:hypothetical protein
MPSLKHIWRLASIKQSTGRAGPHGAKRCGKKIKSIYLSISVLIFLSISLPASIFLPRLAVYLSTCLSAVLPIYLFTILSICLSIYLSIYLPIDLSVCLCFFLFFYLPSYLKGNNFARLPSNVYRLIVLFICLFVHLM